MNIKQLLREQKAYISQIADDHTAWLASHNYRTWLTESLNQNLSFLIAHDDYELSASELSHYQQGLQKLKDGIPLAYVTGHQPFWLGDFIVNQHTLIPRADTEVLVKTALDYVDTILKNKLRKLPPEKLFILDMGTGSGCVAISLAMSLEQKKVEFQMTAIDYSSEALQVAELNALQNKTSVDFLQGDWFSPIQAMQKFNIIVSNPPYIDPHDPHLSSLTDEPITALVAQNHGLADIFTIIEGAKNHLKPDGLLAIEHGYDQGEEVRNYFLQQGFYQVNTEKDMGENDRVTYGIWQD